MNQFKQWHYVILLISSLFSSFSVSSTSPSPASTPTRSQPSTVITNVTQSNQTTPSVNLTTLLMATMSQRTGVSTLVKPSPTKVLTAKTITSHGVKSNEGYELYEYDESDYEVIEVPTLPPEVVKYNELFAFRDKLIGLPQVSEKNVKTIVIVVVVVIVILLIIILAGALACGDTPLSRNGKSSKFKF
ncbi:putative transmembrane protein [Serpentovirinae sp. isolate C18]|uniref:Transmembrane protein n=1 Tax=Serpentovirinae sp. isolate C18 TaxID=3071291 RepID=A0AAE6TVU0_9NIDO|nr:putative transmembrane protein [Serpentovirinae sp.]QFU19719.1 putative transmembrane protein [Serpentovirinae sp.]